MTSSIKMVSVAIIALLFSCDSENTTTQTAQAETPPIATDPYVGVWSDDNYPIIEITKENDSLYTVKEYYGKDPKETTGTEYNATIKNNQLVALGNPTSFYKHEIPTFNILDNGKLKMQSGTGPFELNKKDHPMLSGVQYKKIPATTKQKIK